MQKSYLKRCIPFALVVVSMLLSGPKLAAQPLSILDSLEVLENAVVLRSAMAGGLNQPQFSPIDLNGDANMDLIIFDRAGGAIVPFINGGTAGSIDYQFAPEYIDAFPVGMKHWMLARDYNCDGKMDLFTASDDGMDLYENVSTPGNLAFQLVIDSVKSDLGAGPIHLYIPSTDIPGLDDIDGDGDLDLLIFDAGGIFVEYHQNMYMENEGTCAGMELMRADACWGKFRENSLSQDVTLNQSCRVSPGEAPAALGGVHAGSTLATFDEEADGVKELVLGDLIFAGLTYLHNGGTATAALMDSSDNLFPIYDTPAKVYIFPAAFFMDVNNDGKEDMIAAPNGVNTSVNRDNVWYYRNVAPGNGVRLSLEAKTVLVDEMMDVGMGAYPVFFDYNGDSLLDMLVGNFSLKLTNTNVTSGLALYENIGTKTDPRYELITRDYNNFSTIFTPEIFGMTPAVGDLDNDGDVDLLIGDLDGKVHYFENIAATGQPVNFVLAAANYKGIDIGQFATPTIVDVDRDGLNDLVIGEQWGNLNYFKNIGTAQQADFASTPTNDLWGGVDTEPVCCSGFSVPFILENPSTGRYDLFVGSEEGNLLYYKDIESNLTGNFPLTSSNFGNLRVGGRTAIYGADINDDAQMDWVVGNVRGGMTFYTGNDLLTAAAAPVSSLADIQLYPNPSQGELNIRYTLERGKAISISVMDLNGRTMHQMTQAGLSGNLTVAADQWAPGIYFVSMKVDGEFAGVKKWVLTR